MKEFLDTSVQLVTYDLADDVLFDVTEYRAEKQVRFYRQFDGTYGDFH